MNSLIDTINIDTGNIDTRVFDADQQARQVSRRVFLGRAGSLSLGSAALASLLAKDLAGGEPALPAGEAASSDRVGGLAGLPHFPPTAKRVIFLFQSGAPSQLDLFDHKPNLAKRRGQELPDSIRGGQRLTGMTSRQASFPVAPAMFQFRQRGESGAWISDLLPHTAGVADELCFVKSLHTDAINHDPAITFLQTGTQLAGRPSIGSWLAYGLGSSNENLPAFVAMVSGSGGQPLYDRLWGSGFLASKYQGIKFRSQGDPVLFLSNPAGIDSKIRRQMLNRLAQLNQLKLAASGDAEIETRIAQYELAFRMQSSVPELTDVSKEPAATFKAYGENAKKPGSYAFNCLLARRLVQRGVRFVQLFHRGWDQHVGLPKAIAKQCGDTDQASAALVEDLRRLGMLEDTLVVWGGEFGRTVYCQGKLTANDYGRDHHPRCFTMWMAGGGVRPGMSFGETDEYGYNVVRDPAAVHDLHATMLHCLGIDHKRLTFQYQGRHHRLTDVHGSCLKSLLKNGAVTTS